MYVESKLCHPIGINLRKAHQHRRGESGGCGVGRAFRVARVPVHLARILREHDPTPPRGRPSRPSQPRIVLGRPYNDYAAFASRATARVAPTMTHSLLLRRYLTTSMMSTRSTACLSNYTTHRNIRMPGADRRHRPGQEGYDGGTGR